MKLRPVLTAGAIGTLIAAAHAIPAHATEEDETHDVVIIEAQITIPQEETPPPEPEPVPAQPTQASIEDAPVVEVTEAVEEPPPPEPEPAVTEPEPLAEAEEAFESVPEEAPVEEEAVEESESSEESPAAAEEEAAEETLEAEGAPANTPEPMVAAAQQQTPAATAQTTQVISDQQVTVVPAEELAQALVGENIEILNVTYTGHEQAAGLFSGFHSAIGIDSGVILSTGYAEHQYSSTGDIDNRGVLYGPNVSGSTTGVMSTPGDDDLSELISATTRDAAVLEIEFIPTHDTVAFTYVFGSEEYLEYVGSQYNDVFAFFVNGVNYATLADGTPVSINNINHQENSEFFRNNPRSSQNASPRYTGLDGMTVVLGFEAPVTPGISNLLKLAIADVMDNRLDSAVMIQAGSFTSPVANTPPVADNKTVTTDLNTPVTIVLTGSDADGDTLTFKIVNTDDLAGTLNLDGANVVFTPNTGFFGNTYFTYVVNDGKVDSDEATVTIYVQQDPAPEAKPDKETPEKQTPEKTIKPAAAEITETTTVDKAPVVETPTLARTGASSAPLAMGGGILLVAGVALVIWRRRSQQ